MELARLAASEKALPCCVTVDQFASLLHDPNLEVVRDGYYKQGLPDQGYWAELQVGECTLRYSVSGMKHPVTPSFVAAAITALDRRIGRENVQEHDGGLCFEATVRAGDHSYMLNAP